MGIDLKEIREQCDEFDPEDGCDSDFAEECPYHRECKEDFENPTPTENDIEDEEDDD